MDGNSNITRESKHFHLFSEGSVVRITLISV
jgi:hypothetical protein